MKNIILMLPLFLTTLAFAADVKEADLAGSWYPASKAKLETLIQGYLDDAAPEEIDGDIIALISPHAGCQFSGPVAAYGFKAVQGQDIKTVIIIGFAHRQFFNGISVYDRGSWRTPLGEAQVDASLAKEIISKNPRIRFEPKLFSGENSVELEVPFIQAVFKDARIVPIAFGTQDYKDASLLASSLSAVLKDKTGILIVASTDMSHYHPYDEANSIDRRTIELLNKMDAKELYEEGRRGSCELCGLLPVAATILAAKDLGFDKIKILKYANSGDTFGDKSRVVGYVSAAVYKSIVNSPQSIVKNEGEAKKQTEKDMLSEAQRKRLLQIARESVTSYVKARSRKSFTESDPVLNQPMGAFVTLRENGELRGCIGNMVGQGPLYQTVADMAVEAATGDPRFPPLSPAEIEKIDIEISVLSPLKKVASHQEVKIPGHGVLIRRGFASGVYLPQVATETGWNKEQFLTSLSAHKAGLPAEAWKDPATDIYIFSAEVFGEKGEGQ